MDSPLAVAPDDPLAQPTRAALFALLGELKRPTGTAELAERLDLHPNGVRIHLDRLEEAGLVERARARQARGRPRDAWTIAPDAQPGSVPPRAYQDLGRWLARVLQGKRSSLRSIEQTGREIGRELAPADAGGDLESLRSTLTALGFQPTVQSQEGGRLTFCLRNCPYSAVVRDNQPAICTLHKGITRGLLDVLDLEAELVGFVPRDPDEAGCLIELGGVSETSS
jgi:predicted ArsR family transcriptional regulator